MSQFCTLTGSGRVTQVNEALEDKPEIVNEAAEDAGWIAIIEPANLDEVKNLMTREAYEAYLKELA